jgi:hypothetical protein
MEEEQHAIANALQEEEPAADEDGIEPKEDGTRPMQRNSVVF